jgi:hypothetical protein
MVTRVAKTAFYDSQYQLALPESGPAKQIAPAWRSNRRSLNKKGVPVSNAETSSLPALTGPLALLRVEALPVERHPAAVYLASLGSGSRRTMRQSLGVIANLVSGGRADIRTLAWEALRYQGEGAGGVRLEYRILSPGTMPRPPRVEFPGALYSRTAEFFSRDGASIARDVLALDQSSRDSKELQSRIDNLARSLTRT